MENTIRILGFADPFSSWSHLIAAVSFLGLSLGMLWKGRGNGLRLASLAVYCFSIVFLLSMSGVYHILEHGTTARSVLQRLDHAGIWTLILGTFTPIHTILFTGWWRWGILLLIWSVGITGLVLEVIFMQSIPEWMSLSFYLSLGWLGLLSSRQTRREHPEMSLVPMVWGGLAYSLGACFDFLRWPIIVPGIFGGHELFHIFVIVGIFCHWIFIERIAGFGISKRLTLRIKRRSHHRSFATADSENIRFFFSDTEEFNRKLHTLITSVYGSYRRPEAIRLQYIDEHFVDPSSPTISKADPANFFNSKS